MIFDYRIATVRKFKPETETCIWCRRECSGTDLTVEHIVPVSCKGSDRKENLAWACQTCNELRSRVVVARGNRKQLEQKLRWGWWTWRDGERATLIRQVDQHNRRVPRALADRDQWERLERLRIGHSPSAEVPLYPIWLAMPVGANESDGAFPDMLTITSY